MLSVYLEADNAKKWVLEIDRDGG